MSDSPLQSALREMRHFGRSSRLWLTFGAVVLLFSVTGPFGTDDIPFLPRLAYWFALHAATWSVALAFALGGEILLRRHVRSMLARMLAGSLAAALPIGLVVGLLGLAWFGRTMTLASYLSEVAVSLPLCGIFCALTYMTMSGDPGLKAAGVVQPPPSGADPDETAGESREPALLRRLAPHNRGRLRHISVEDHYSMVRTSGGSELILMRFSDAIRETEPAEGMQVNRSHWVAGDFVDGLRLANGRLTIVLKDGTEVPVSRTYAEAVREKFGRSIDGAIPQNP